MSDGGGGCGVLRAEQCSPLAPRAEIISRSEMTTLKNPMKLCQRPHRRSQFFGTWLIAIVSFARHPRRQFPQVARVLNERFAHSRRNRDWQELAPAGSRVAENAVDEPKPVGWRELDRPAPEDKLPMCGKPMHNRLGCGVRRPTHNCRAWRYPK